MECIYGAWQMTGCRKYLEEFLYRLDVLHKLQLPDGSMPEHIDLDKVEVYPEVDGDHGCSSSLPLDYISSALTGYFYDTGDVKAGEVLMRLVECVMRRDPRLGEMYPDVSDIRILAWAYNETGDSRYYERLEYLVFSMAAKPFEKWPETAEEWVAGTFEVMQRQEWRIRHIGPGIRMIPYGLKVMLKGKSKGDV
jgi:hypothetical protein